MTAIASSRQSRGLCLVALVGLSSGVAITHPLWTGAPTFPPLPIFPFRSNEAVATAWTGGAFLFAVAGGFLACAVRRRWTTSTALLLTLSFLFACATDQSRLQPWAVFYVAVLLALGVVPPSAPRAKPTWTAWPSLDALAVVRLLLVSTYFSAGAHKVNDAFAELTLPRMLAVIPPLQRALIDMGPSIGKAVAYSVALLEILIGAALSCRSARRVGVYTSVAFHATVLALLGPWGQDLNPAIWPWNVAMPALVAVAFRDIAVEQRAAAPLEGVTRVEKVGDARGARRGRRIAYVLIALFTVGPLASLFGFWDLYPAQGVYSGTGATASVTGPPELIQCLHPSVHDVVTSDPREPGQIRLSVSRWAWRARKAPVYPETRTVRQAALTICACAARPAGVRLIVTSRAAWGRPVHVESANCPGPPE